MYNLYIKKSYLEKTEIIVELAILFYNKDVQYLATIKEINSYQNLKPGFIFKVDENHEEQSDLRVKLGLKLSNDQNDISEAVSDWIRKELSQFLIFLKEEVNWEFQESVQIFVTLPDENYISLLAYSLKDIAKPSTMYMN
jgi:hypothetical protein